MKCFLWGLLEEGSIGYAHHLIFFYSIFLKNKLFRSILKDTMRASNSTTPPTSIELDKLNRIFKDMMRASNSTIPPLQLN